MAKSLREQLIGTWKLVKYTLKDENGKEFYPMGEGCTGFLIYSPDGHVSAQLMASKRPAYSSGDLHHGTWDEMAAAAEGYMAYAGKFEVNEKEMTLIHQMAVSMNPTWLGQKQARYFKIQGNKVTITTDFNTAVLVWEKADPV